MKVAAVDRAASVLLILVAAALSGCATAGLPRLKDVAARREKRSEAALDQFKRGRDIAQFESAQARFREGDLKGCREQLQTLLAENPGHPGARLLMAELLLADNRPAEAADCVLPLLGPHGEDARVQYTMGLALDAGGQPEAAKPYYERAAKLDPDNELYAMAYRNATASVAQRDLAVAKDPRARAAENRSATRPEIPVRAPLSNLGGATPVSYSQVTSEDERLRPAEPTPGPSAVRRAFDARPSQPSEQVESKGAGSAGGGVYAEQTARAGAAGAQSASELFEQGARALAEEDPTTALACFRQVAAQRPHDAQMLIGAAVLALQYNQPCVAVDLLEPCVAGFSRPAAMYRVLGTAYYRQGNYPAAEAALQQALSLDNSSALTYFLMGCTLEKLGRAEAAERQFRQAESLDARYAARRRGAATGTPSLR